VSSNVGYGDTKEGNDLPWDGLGRPEKRGFSGLPEKSESYESLTELGDRGKRVEQLG